MYTIAAKVREYRHIVMIDDIGWLRVDFVILWKLPLI